jgi:hypothetical protein
VLTKILALTGFALLTSSSAIAAAGGCHAISGTYQNQNVPCVPPAIACVESQVTGDHAGTSLTRITGFDPATGVFTGTVTAFLINGAVLESTITGTLAAGSVITFTGGTRQYAHVTGTSRTTPAVGGAGTYAGEYCLGDGRVG